MPHLPIIIATPVRMRRAALSAPCLLLVILPVTLIFYPSPAPGTPAPPMVPAMDEITSSSAIVRWNPIPERFSSGEITNYVINYRIFESANRLLVPECIIGGAENADRNLTVDGDLTNATLQNLSNDI